MKNFNVTSMLVMLMFMCITSMQAQSITPSKKYITKELNNVSNFSSIRVLGSPTLSIVRVVILKQQFLYMVRITWLTCWKYLR